MSYDQADCLEMIGMASAITTAALTPLRPLFFKIHQQRLRQKSQKSSKTPRFTAGNSATCRAPILIPKPPLES
jgi:hypothetical protein